MKGKVIALGTKGGPGGTIAHGMVFSFVAGRHAAGQGFFGEE